MNDHPCRARQSSAPFGLSEARPLASAEKPGSRNWNRSTGIRERDEDVRQARGSSFRILKTRRARRRPARLDICVVNRIELRPQNVTLGAQGAANQFLLLRSARIPRHPVNCEIYILGYL